MTARQGSLLIPKSWRVGGPPAPQAAARPSQDPSSERRRIWTNDEIRRFYADRANGRYDGREAESNRIEQETLAAAREGRVAATAVQPRMPDGVS